MPKKTDKPEGDLENADFIAELLARLASGENVQKTLRSYSGDLERRFWKKCYLEPNFALTIARAREAGIDALVSETLTIADEADETNYNSAKLKIHARQWLASKLNHKRYGDKGLLGSGDTNAPTELIVRWGKPRETKDIISIEATESDTKALDA
jgi:predicted DNA-binding ribbon-helix-helix protein